jgi:uroporphyrinogen decarboxylase
MRQAGRALPEYRALKKKHSFIELVQTPDLATEVTLQPIRRFGFDGAVIFSDILVAAEAMGQRYRFRESGGIEMEFPIRSAADVDRLSPDAVPERTQYLGRALRQVRHELANRAALLGFAGSPWTLANYMLEGGSSPEPLQAKRLFHLDRPLLERLLSRITQAVSHLLRLQIDSGADAVQIFDTCGESLAADTYDAASARWIREIVASLPTSIPVLLYVRGAPHAISCLADSGLRGFSVDWRMDLPGLRRQLPPRTVLQGNLDPSLMLTSPGVVTSATLRMLDSMRQARGYIVNLGHGLPAGSSLENIEALTTAVKTFRSSAP